MNSNTRDIWNHIKQKRPGVDPAAIVIYVVAILAFVMVFMMLFYGWCRHNKKQVARVAPSIEFASQIYDSSMCRPDPVHLKANHNKIESKEKDKSDEQEQKIYCIKQ